jgi:glycine hydroxymethyltransferase
LSEEKVVEYVRTLRNAVRAHEKWRTNSTLNLIASENFASPEARYYLSTDLSNRYSARDHFYRGTKFTDEIEDLAVEVAKKLYNCKYADVRAISGHTCSLILFLSLLKPGNKVVTCPTRYGGYPGSSDIGLGSLLSLKNLYFPYDPQAMNIIPSETAQMIGQERPELTVFGSSFIPFPYEIKRSLPPDYGGIVAYDASHVMGLIAGGEFQQPLKEGCSVMMGSTHKSLFGPQGGLILSSDDQVFSRLDAKVHPGIVDNIHWNRVASLAFAMMEMLKFGKKYAAQVVNNSKALARALDDLGVPVKCKALGFTQSHQVLLGFGATESPVVADKLQEVDIIADSGIRLGTSEVTRRGMRQNEMGQIALLVADAIRGSNSKAELRKRVHRLVKEFDGLEFSLSRM